MEEKEKHCSHCYGFGWWPIGDLVPIGPLDAREWKDKVIKCPWCKAGTNIKGERYQSLLKASKDRR